MRKFLSGILSLLLLMGLLPAAYAEEPALGVTYEIFVASFQDSGGDGIGDLQGIIDRLICSRWAFGRFGSCLSTPPPAITSTMCWITTLLTRLTARLMTSTA